MFAQELKKALEEIKATEHKEYLVQEGKEIANDNKKEGLKSKKDRLELIERYGKIKQQIAELLNQRYNHLLQDKIDYYNWLYYNQNDETAYFLSEAGANCWNYAEQKAPHRINLWMGEKGFVIGIEQKGKGFDAREVDRMRIKTNEGEAFNFFRKCKSTIFFDDMNKANQVYMKFIF